MSVSFAPVNVAAVGLGWVCTHRHLPVMRRNPNFNIVGVIDRNAARAHQVAAEFGIPRVATTDQWHDIPWWNEVEAVTIAVNPHAHYEAIKTALEAGKHVLTEKPFVLEVEQGRELVELAQAKQKILSIVHNFQFSRSFLALQRDIRTNRLGTLTSIQALQFSNPNRRLPVWYDSLPLGLFTDESPHLLYLLRAITPDLQFAAAHGAPGPELNTPSLLYAQFSGTWRGKPIPISLQFNFVASLSEWQIGVFGTRACGFVDIFRDIYVRLPNDGLHTSKTVVRTSLSTTWQHWLQHVTNGPKHLRGELFYGNETVFARFANAVRDGKAPQGISSDDALAVLELQHQIIDRVTSAPGDVI